MDLHLENGSNGHQVRECTANGVRVDNQLLTRSFLLTPDRIEADIALDTVQGLDDEAESSRIIERLLVPQPELVLLGTGTRLQFPSPRFQAALLRHGIGLESMDNAAAARTFNLLAGENRRVVALFLLPAGVANAG
ncbi:MAG: hypothetical protein KDI75_09160 [Xanthomonadales bacterium]|nr:hypothetical protein [Xanthomonadales bacterium]